MHSIFLARLQQGHRTMKYPDGPPPPMPERFRGRPCLSTEKCVTECRACLEVCPTKALSREAAGGGIRLDLGRCLFCGECERSCPHDVIHFSREHRLAVRDRDDLQIGGAAGYKLAAALEEKMKRIFGHSLKLRQVSAGGCNACEADVNVLNTVGWDLGRFGIGFVASPRHADGLLITGPVPDNMQLALRKTYDAVPGPKIVIAVGGCAVAGGPYAGHEEVAERGAASIVPVDLFIPGCPAASSHDSRWIAAAPWAVGFAIVFGATEAIEHFSYVREFSK